MAYDEQLADRVREAIEGEPGLTEKRMFGGLAFLVRGHMAVAASGQGGLMVRCDEAESDALTSRPGVTRVEMRGREMAGWLRIESDAVAEDGELRHWVDVGVARARALPPK
jgi:TfoX/Sxy family transcriptional regulator of competence genes